MPELIKEKLSLRDISAGDLARALAKETNPLVNKLRDGWNDLVSVVLPTLGVKLPVGSIYTSVLPTNPATSLGYGTWAAFGAGRVLVGIDAGQTEFDTVLETGGAKTHTLTESEMPAHTHVQDAHTHVQDSHSHTMSGGQTDDTTVPLDRPDAATSGSPSTLTTPTNGTVAVNQNTVAVNQNTGGGGAHNNLQPYIVVYVWERTA